VKFDAADAFHADYKRLSEQEKARFRDAVRLLNQAYEMRGTARIPHWPAVLRIKGVQGQPGVWEMTWSFAGPDGRATFEFAVIDGDMAIRWLRIGDHSIFRE
jgi:hypothetical protein